MVYRLILDIKKRTGILHTFVYNIFRILRFFHYFYLFFTKIFRKTNSRHDDVITWLHSSRSLNIYDLFSTKKDKEPFRLIYFYFLRLYSEFTFCSVFDTITTVWAIGNKNISSFIKNSFQLLLISMTIYKLFNDCSA